MRNQLFIVILLISFTHLAQAQYQNHSGLKNRRLRLVNMDNKSRFEEVQSGLPPADEKLPAWPPRGSNSSPQSSIDSVVVLDDAPQHLIVQVYFSGINKGVIQAEASSNKEKVLPSFKSSAISVSQGQSPLELTLKGAMPENTEIQSKQLSVEIVDPQRIVPNKYYIYALNKRWNTQIKAENLKQSILLEPIGSAVSLWQLSPTAPLPNSNTIVNTTINKNEGLVKVIASTTPTDKNAKGPSRHSFSLWDNIQTDVDFELSEISNIKTEIHPDVNPASETFYISPVGYNLRWTEEEGFKHFKILYGSNNEVQFHVGLSAGVTTKQLDLIRYLIKKRYKSQNIEIQNPKIQLLGANTMPSISLKGDFQGVFQIDPSKVTITTPPDFTSPLTVSWTTDNKTKDMIVLALQNGIGLNGSLTFGTDSIMRQIPLTMSFSNQRNYGKIILSKENWRKAEWQNLFPYPIKLRFLHALLENTDPQRQSANHIYTWNCNSTLAPSGSRVAFDAGKIPTWFDNSDKVIQLWLEYEVEVCPACTQRIINAVTGNLAGSPETNLIFQSMDLVSSLDAKLIQIRVRSLQADPSHRKEVELMINLSKDGEDVSIGPFFTGIDKRISYQYKVLIVNNQALIETNWISDTNLQQYLNKAGLEKIIGRSLR